MKKSELKRTTPLQRTTFKPKEQKPAAGPKQKKCAVRACRKPFIPPESFVTWCSPDCGEVLAMEKLAKQKAKAQRQERAADKIKREGMKTYPQLIREAQTAFNAFIRERDKDLPCICCGRTETMISGLNSHGWDCGHYRSTGSAPHLRFTEDNAARQLVLCNRYGAGRAVDYRIGLIARIGLERVETLEADNNPRKWTHEELREIKELYKKKLIELRRQGYAQC